MSPFCHIFKKNYGVTKWKQIDIHIFCCTTNAQICGCGRREQQIGPLYFSPFFCLWEKSLGSLRQEQGLLSMKEPSSLPPRNSWAGLALSSLENAFLFPYLSICITLETRLGMQGKSGLWGHVSASGGSLLVDTYPCSMWRTPSVTQHTFLEAVWSPGCSCKGKATLWEISPFRACRCTWGNPLQRDSSCISASTEGENISSLPLPMRGNMEGAESCLILRCMRGKIPCRGISPHTLVNMAVWEGAGSCLLSPPLPPSRAGACREIPCKRLSLFPKLEHGNQRHL